MLNINLEEAYRKQTNNNQNNNHKPTAYRPNTPTNNGKTDSKYIGNIDKPNR